MTRKDNTKAIAKKIKKWLEAVRELKNQKRPWALQVTRLISIKSLCQTQQSAKQFALYLSRRVQQQMNETHCPEELTPEEWERHKALVAEAVAQMEKSLEVPLQDRQQGFRNLLSQIDTLQGDDVRRVHWTTVHFVRSGYLLKLDYALRCFVGLDFTDWVYKLARKYTERYSPACGSGLTPESVSPLLEVAEFWCQYYFDQTLQDKFPQLMAEVESGKVS